MLEQLLFLLTPCSESRPVSWPEPERCNPFALSNKLRIQITVHKTLFMDRNHCHFLSVLLTLTFSFLKFTQKPIPPTMSPLLTHSTPQSICTMREIRKTASFSKRLLSQGPKALVRCRIQNSYNKTTSPRKHGRLTMACPRTWIPGIMHNVRLDVRT